MKRCIPNALRIPIFLLFAGLTHLVLGQNPNPACTPPPPFVGCGSDCFTQFTMSELSNLPIATISLDFHFVKSNGNNFQCTNPASFDYAPTYVQQIINLANEHFSDPDQNQFGTSPHLPDARIRYQLYGNPSNPCDAIFFYDDQASITYSNPNAFHIIVRDDGGSIGISGNSSSPINEITLNNIHRAVFQYLLTDVSTGGRILNHEMGHHFGLCHSYSTAYNVCPDIDPAAECGGPSATMCGSTPCSSTQPLPCGLGGCYACYCTTNTGNNFMGSNESMRGMTYYQWAQLYGSIIKARPSFVAFYGLSCVDIPAHPPLEIPANTIVEWNSFRFLNQHVEVRPGATLIIRCEVQVAKNLPIIVNRGARLFVIGGSIASQSPDCRWDGILVHGNANMDQPDLSVAQDETQSIPINGAGVVWLNGAVLKNAHTGISTKGSGGLGADYHGGLVMVDNSDFINNGRAVEFLKYKKSNKSYFKNSEIYTDGSTPWPTDRGVSIWACHNIKFSNTHFCKNQYSGIEGIDFSTVVEDCSFKDSQYGFKSEATTPNVALGTTLIEGCDFSKNLYDVYCNASPNMIYGYEITDNDFFDGRNGGYGVRIRGESSFNIGHNNTFKDKKLHSNWLNSTGSLFNKVQCNVYETHSPFGVFSSMYNANLEILGNDFLGSSGTEIQVGGNASQYGVVGPQQGDAAEAAGNCFANPASAIRTSSGQTVPFDYYVHNLGSPVFCEKPTNNLSDGGVNNYKVIDSDGGYEGCDGRELPPVVTEGDLYLARENTAAKKTAWLADLQNAQKKSEYLTALKTQDLFLRTLVSGAFAANNLDVAENLLLGENTNTHRRGVVGLRTMRGNITGAQSLLNSMPVENQDDQWFKDIMAVNFAIEQSPTPYELPAAQDALLQTIANTPHSIMSGYACALLSLCKGYTCEEPWADEGGERDQPDAGATATDKQVRVYPNPTAGSLTLECPAQLGEMLTLDLLDMSGSRVKNLQFANNGVFSFDCPEIREGVYLLRLYNSNQILHTVKIVVLR